MADVSSTISPFGLRPVQPFVVGELDSRALEYDMNIDEGGVTVNGEFISNYSGPRTAWARVCSNGTGKALGDKTTTPGRHGFVMGFSTVSFDDTYGFGQSGKTTIGYDTDGDPHTLTNSEVKTFPHRPSPGIISIETEFNGAGSSMVGLARKATIKWKCSTLEQLNYMTPYFLTPKMSVILEWGWNNYDPLSLTDLRNLNIGTPAKSAADAPPNGWGGSGMTGMMTNSKLIYDKIEKSKGNYDCQMGIIVDYGYTINASDGFDCYTVIQNPQFLMDGMPIRGTTTTLTEADVSHRTLAFQEFVDKFLDNIGDKKTIDSLTKDPELRKIFSSTNFFSFSQAKYKNLINEDKKGTWIRMDLFSQIFNKFQSPKWKFFTGNTDGRLFQIDISDTIIVGHPFLKSTDENVLVPNKYAPRALAISDEKPNDGISYSRITDTAAKALYPGELLDAIFTKQKLSQDYDDLDELLNRNTVKTSNEPTNFPRLEEDRSKGFQSGYYGYLKDIFISVDLIKTAMKQNDTSAKMLQFILDRISSACSNLWEFKIAFDPDQMLSPIKIIDQNYCNFNTPEAVVNAKIPTFVVGDSSRACFKEFTVNVKMTGEMAMQAIFGQSANSSTPDGTTVDTKPVLFLHNDRLFDGSAKSAVSHISTSDDPVKKLIDRSSVSDFLVMKFSDGTTKKSTGGNLQAGEFAGIRVVSNSPTVSRTYLLTERDSEFMAGLVKSKISDGIPTVSNPIMPGTELTMTSIGIGGFRFLDMFGVMGMQDQYQADQAVWQIDGVKQSLTQNFWTTTVSAKVRPLTIIKT